MEQAEAGFRVWVVRVTRKGAKRTEVVFMPSTEERGETQRNRPVVGDQILDITAGRAVLRRRAERAEDQVYQLVAHEVVLGEHGEDEVVVLGGDAAAASPHVGIVVSVRLGAQERSSASD